MQALNLPSYDFRSRENGKVSEIFDPVRTKWVPLTPEEWVRQHLIDYLIRIKDCPKGLMAVEKEWKIDKLKRRPDIVIFDSNAKAKMVIECKAPEVEISEEVLYQIALYNKVLGAPVLLLSNGLTHYCASINFNESRLELLNEIPSYPELCAFG